MMRVKRKNINIYNHQPIDKSKVASAREAVMLARTASEMAYLKNGYPTDIFPEAKDIAPEAIEEFLKKTNLPLNAPVTKVEDDSKVKFPSTINALNIQDRELKKLLNQVSEKNQKVDFTAEFLPGYIAGLNQKTENKALIPTSQQITEITNTNKISQCIEKSDKLEIHTKYVEPECIIEKKQPVNDKMVAQMKNLWHGKYIHLIKLYDKINKLKDRGDISDIVCIAMQLENEYSISPANKTILARLNYARLVAYSLNYKNNYINNPLACKLYWLVEIASTYLDLLEYCSIEIIQHIKLNQLWDDIVLLLPAICRNNFGIKLRSNNPRFLQESILKFITDYIDKGFLIQTKPTRITRKFTTSFEELQRQLHNLNNTESTTESYDKTLMQKSRFLLNTDQANLQTCIELIHAFCSIYPEDQLPELIKSARALQREYIPSLSQNELKEYYNAVDTLCCKMLASKNHPILQQYFIDTKNIIERSYAERYPGKSIMFVASPKKLTI